MLQAVSASFFFSTPMHPFQEMLAERLPASIADQAVYIADVVARGRFAFPYEREFLTFTPDALVSRSRLGRPMPSFNYGRANLTDDQQVALLKQLPFEVPGTMQGALATGFREADERSVGAKVFLVSPDTARVYFGTLIGVRRGLSSADLGTFLLANAVKFELNESVLSLAAEWPYMLLTEVKARRIMVFNERGYFASKRSLKNMPQRLRDLPFNDESYSFYGRSKINGSKRPYPFSGGVILALSRQAL